MQFFYSQLIKKINQLSNENLFKLICAITRNVEKIY
jgi:hypothetical protein